MSVPVCAAGNTQVLFSTSFVRSRMVTLELVSNFRPAEKRFYEKIKLGFAYLSAYLYGHKVRSVTTRLGCVKGSCASDCATGREAVQGASAIGGSGTCDR